MTEKLLLTQGEAAQVLGISPDLLRQLVREGRIRTVKVGKRVMFSRAALEAFAAGEEPREVFIG
jgi:excisionase family DNA binding protein